MRRCVTRVLATSILFGGLLFATLDSCKNAAADEPSALQADREFVQAAAKDEKARVAALLDSDFTWTDADGKTLSRADVLSSFPTPALGDEAGAHQRRQARSQ